MSTTTSFASKFRFSLFARLFYLVTRIGLPPIVLSFVSVTEYGIWSIGFVVVAYLGLSAAGFSTVYIRSAAKWVRDGDLHSLNRTVSTGVFTLMVLGTTLCTAVYFSAPSILDFFNIEYGQRELATMCIVGCAWVFIMDMCLGASAWLLHGIGKFEAEQRVWVASYCLEMGVAVACLFSGLGVLSLLVAFAVRYAFSLTMNARLARRAIPGLSVSIRHFNSESLAQFFKYGGVVQLSSVAGTFFHSIDRVMAGMLMGPSAAALFDLAGKLPSTAISIPSAVNAAAMPMAASHEHQRQHLVDLGKKANQWIVLLLFVPMPILSAYAPQVFHVWLGPVPLVVQLAEMMAAMAVAWHLHVLTGPVCAIYRGTGRAKREFIYHSLRGLCYAMAFLFCWFVGFRDPVTLAHSLSLAMGVAALLFLLVTCYEINNSLLDLIKDLIFPIALAYTFAYLLAPSLLQEQSGAAGVLRMQALVQLVYGAALQLALFVLYSWLFILEESQKQVLRAKLGLVKTKSNSPRGLAS